MELENSSVEAAVEVGREAAAPEEVTETNENVQSEEIEQQTEEPAEIPNKVWEISRKRAESEAQKRVDAEFARRFAGHTNPVTGKPIATMEDYFAALDAQQQRRTEAQLKEQGIDPEVLNQAVQQNPVVRQAQQVLARQQADHAQREIQDQIGEITKLDPAVKGLGDIVKLAEFGRFDALVRSGMKLDDAYKLACFDRLAQQRTDAAKQAAINAAKGKQHLTVTDGVGEVASEIPAGELEKWKSWFPEKNAEQLNALYKKVHNR